jgi:hypothetical protein
MDTHLKEVKIQLIFINCNFTFCVKSFQQAFKELKFLLERSIVILSPKCVTIRKKERQKERRKEKKRE